MYKRQGGGYGGGIGLPIPYWDTEYGYTKQYKKWKIKSISKSKKKYTVLRQKISVQRFGKYVEVKKGFLIKEFCFVWDRQKIDQRRQLYE